MTNTVAYQGTDFFTSKKSFLVEASYFRVLIRTDCGGLQSKRKKNIFIFFIFVRLFHILPKTDDARNRESLSKGKP